MITCERSEPHIENINFKVHKFNNRERKDNVVIIPMFSEFGCETLGVLYCIPWLLRNRLAGKYTIVMGWLGREYFYRHLVDEFWELSEDYQWLRKYCKAFHHESKNLKAFEKQASEYGTVINIGEVANVAVYPFISNCMKCNGSMIHSDINQRCIKCDMIYPKYGFFSDLNHAKEMVRWLPEPQSDNLNEFLPPNAVGICARNRETYQRNLSIQFYRRLIRLLKDMGYNPVWFGEKSSIHKCPENIPDFSESPLSLKLENTLALMKGMEFTIQFYTASSRLAAMVGTPYMIIESPDQIWGIGQEGIRLNLMSKNNKRKLIACEFTKARDNNNELLNLISEGIVELERHNYCDIIGLVADHKAIETMRKTNSDRIGDFLRYQ